MPWQEATVVSLREEFVILASAEGANMRALCRQFGISPTTGYKLVGRWRAEGVAGLADRSRRPRASPRQTAPAIEAAILDLRAAHPAWGPRKLRQGLLDAGAAPPLPAVSTIARSCAGMAASTQRWRPNTRPGAASSTPPPTNCGRWTSRAISRSPMAPAVIP